MKKIALTATQKGRQHSLLCLNERSVNQLLFFDYDIILPYEDLQESREHTKYALSVVYP